MWQAQLRSNKKWELVNVVGGYIVNRSNIVSNDLSVIIDMAAYMEHGLCGALPAHIRSDLDYIRSQGANYCPCYIKVPLC